MAIAATLDLERALYKRGHRFIAGLDEAGRGAWAGPVVAAAVVLPLERVDLSSLLNGVCDSKQLAPHVRVQVAQCIWDVALAVGVGVSAPAMIDREGIVPATRHAMMQALRRLCIAPEALVVDYMRLPQVDLPQYVMPHADAHHLCVAAASIIAKVTRDRLMMLLAQRYPGYGFATHKGYGTPDHYRSLIQRGITPIHRRSFAPVRTLAGGCEWMTHLDEFDNQEHTC